MSSETRHYRSIVAGKRGDWNARAKKFKTNSAIPIASSKTWWQYHNSVSPRRPDAAQTLGPTSIAA